jgi:hypothetical protein
MREVRSERSQSARANGPRLTVAPAASVAKGRASGVAGKPHRLSARLTLASPVPPKV